MRNATRRAPAVVAAALAILAVVSVASAQPVEPATLVLRNGHIATVDDAKPTCRPPCITP